MSEKSLSTAKIGMNKATSANLLKGQQYSHAKNANLREQTGEEINLTNEESNLLASRLKDNYKVIGRKYFFNIKKTFYILTNPETGFSSIGYINDEYELPDLEDTTVDCGDCNSIDNLPTPLEDIDQQPIQSYVELLDDSCAGLDNQTGQGCLNLSVNFPIKSIVFKQEQSGDRLYFTDYLNGVRFIDLNNISRYTQTGSINCDVDTTEDICLDCEKLEVFPNIQVPNTEVNSITNGGELKPGMYEVLVAYSSETGEELSRYYSLTNPVSIFDELNRNVLDRLDRTNFGFDITINDLDSRFANYKLIVIGTDAQRNRFSFVDGIYPTTQNVVNITTERNKPTIDASIPLSLIRPKVEKAKTVSTANGYLFLNSPIMRKPMNLQPVVSLMGAFLKWQTHVAKESLYKNGDFVSKYKGYYRNETYAKSIRFILDGDYSPAYLLVGRPKKASDGALLNTGGDTYNSILNNLKGCTTNLVTEKWQVLNTATVDNTSCENSDDIEYSVITRTEDKFCEQEGVQGETPTWYPSNINIDLSDSEDFISLSSYINDNIKGWSAGSPTWVTQDFLDAFDPTNYTDCTPPGFQETEEIPDGSGGTILVAPDRLITDGEGNPIRGCEPLGNTPEEEVFISEVVEEQQNFIQAEFPEDYPKIPPANQSTCNIYKDLDSALRVMSCSSGVGEPGGLIDSITNRPLRNNLLRAELPYEKSCSGANTLQITDQVNTFQSYTINYFFSLGDIAEVDLDVRYADLVTNKNATAETSVWSPSGLTYLDKIGKNAEWFRIDTNQEDSFILDMSSTAQVRLGTLETKEVRLSIYSSCSNSSSPLVSKVVNIDVGARFKLEKSGEDVIITDEADLLNPITASASNIYYVSIDTPLRIFPFCNSLTTEAEPLAIYNPSTEEFEIPTLMATALPGCFNIAAKPLKNVAVDVTFTDIILNKKDKYITDCYYQVPIIEECKVAPYQKGDFSYTESSEKYPDNKQLFDSSTLTISPDDFLTTEHRNTFEEYFVTNTVDNEYVLNEDTDLTCEPIRHFKYPDNTISPFCTNTPIFGQSESIIFPMGCTIDENLVNSFLDIALKNNLITEQDRKRIRGYEILRADRRGNESVVAKGITYDMLSYNETNTNRNREVKYSNFPFNDLGENRLFYDDNKNFLQPENSGNSNNLWTFHSPDTDYKLNSQNPSLMNVEGYLKGEYTGQFNEVRNHPGYVILGRRLERLASTLATIEVAADAVIASSQAFSNYNQQAGFTNTVFAGAWVATPLIAAFSAISAAIFNYSRYKYEWTESFKNLGKPRNFAYYYSAVGNYSWLDNTIDEEQRVRPLNVAKRIKRGRIQLTDEQDGEVSTINHLLREPSLLLKTPTAYGITYSDSYKNYDNTNTNPNKSSRLFESERGLRTRGLSESVEGNVASMYTSLVNYLPNQYGSVDTLQTKWITTGYTGDLDNPRTDCLPIFGGDVFITRHTLLRRFPIFNSYAIDTADRTPFDYTLYSNVGDSARFFINYDTEGEDASAGRPLPVVDSEYNLDNQEGASGSYVKEPSKFYLFYNGIPNFLVESTINTWNRATRPKPKDNFYPNVEDFMDFTQESVNTIKNQESFLYSQAYSKPPEYFGGNLLPSNYDKELFNKALDLKNGTIYSLKDNNENIKFDPWTVFRQNDQYVFPTDYGQLLDLTSFNKDSILGRFDTTSVLFNAVDTIVDDGQDPKQYALGDGGIFARRPQVLSTSELGQFGSDAYEYVSSQFGKFYVDAKRGKVYRLAGGANKPDVEEISAYSNGKPNGMKHWFRKNLPFRMLKKFPDTDVDNPMNGVGITVGWDNQYNRFFLTKRDYIPKGTVQKDEDGFYAVNEEVKTYVDLSDANYFEDVSFTIAYSPEYGSWISFYDFKPNYYVSKLDYFQSGINEEGDEKGVWSHGLTNKSYGVFYGKKYNFELEYAVQSAFQSKVLENVELWTEARRYKNEYDFDLDNTLTFNESIIYNNYHNSGKLELVPQKNNLFSNGYPKTVGDKQQILISNKDNFKWAYDYFYNRVKDNNNQSMFNTDINGIEKNINTNAVKFKGKRILERLRGDWFLNRLTYNKDSRYSLTFKFAVNETDY